MSSERHNCLGKVTGLGEGKPGKLREEIEAKA